MFNKCYLGYKGKVSRTFKYCEGMMTRAWLIAKLTYEFHLFFSDFISFFILQISDVYDTQTITDILKCFY